MSVHSVRSLIETFKPAALLLALLTLSGCALTGQAVRSWVDEQTAVSVTAQKRVMVFYHENHQAGVNIYDFADLGAFEVNQTGSRHQYLYLMLWSTLSRTAEQQSHIEDAFADLVVWADDQPLTLKRQTQNHEMLHLSNAAFKLSSPDAHENYYDISLAQLSVLSTAKVLRIASANQAQGDTPYYLWRNEHNSLAAFVDEISGTAKLINTQ